MFKKSVYFIKSAIFVWLIVFFLIIAFTQVSAAEGGVTLNASPSTESIKPGNTFTVDLVIDSGLNQIRGWEGTVSFDPKFLSCTGIAEGNFLQNFGTTASLAEPSINNDEGTVDNLAFAVISQTAGGASGTGSLCTLTFKVNKNVKGNTVISPADFIFADEQKEAVQEVILNNCTITIKSSSSGGIGGGGGGNHEETTTTTTTTTTRTLSSDDLPVSTSIPVSTPTPGTIDLGDSLDSGGKFLIEVTAASEDGNAVLLIKQGITGLKSSNEPIDQILIYPLITSPQVPLDFHSCGQIYDLQPGGAFFSDNITLALKYDSTQVKNSSIPFIAVYDSTSHKWEQIYSTNLDAANHLVRCEINHFYTYGVFTRVNSVPIKTSTLSTNNPTRTAGATQNPESTSVLSTQSTSNEPDPEKTGLVNNIWLITGGILVLVIILGLLIYFGILKKRGK